MRPNVGHSITAIQLVGSIDLGGSEVCLEIMIMLFCMKSVAGQGVDTYLTHWVISYAIICTAVESSLWLVSAALIWYDDLSDAGTLTLK